MSDRRLIEVAFPLKQASIDSMHEKNVRHGHISTLHIWPARRPLAASRAALIATLLPDPGTPEKRRELAERIGGHVVKVLKRKQGPGGGEEKVVEETVGGILHWGRETDNKAGLDVIREDIRKAYGGRSPRVLDPFAGGGAIPLEAMRLGCDVTAVDINPVAWFILKCTLEYPQKLAGEKRPLPDCVRTDRDFMEAFFKAQGMKNAMLRTQLKKLGLGDGTKAHGDKQPSLNLEIEGHTLTADLAWHVRAWGWWVIREARKQLAPFYPIYAEWEPLKDRDEWLKQHPDQRRPMQRVSIRDDGTADIGALNAGIPSVQLTEDSQPRWVAKPAVAYLWARTVTCKLCRATIPLLKTRWLAKRDKKRVLLTVEANADRTGVIFAIEENVPAGGGNNAQRREHDKRLGQGTMTRSGAWCPCCGHSGAVAMDREDLRAEAASGRLGRILTAIAIQGPNGKSYRLPTPEDHHACISAESALPGIFSGVPFGIPTENITPGGSRTTGGASVTVHKYGMTTWNQLYTERQLAALGVFVQATRACASKLSALGYSADWRAAICGFLALINDRLADYGSTLTHYQTGGEFIGHTFQRYALPITWDFSEMNPVSGVTGGADSAIAWIGLVADHLLKIDSASVSIRRASAMTIADSPGSFDAIVTDPPYYDAIQYSDLMDYFHVWLRRSVWGLSREIDDAFADPLGPKWNAETADGELIDEPSRHGDDASRSKAAYEDGMARVFSACAKALTPTGRLVVVFANKQPAAWETLVAAVIRAGFVVDGSWPIQTERKARMRSQSSAALASSVWLVCKKRPVDARSGWDNKVLQEMRENIGQKLRDFWDAGIHGPDFVWAATGPAMEAFSKYPIVKKANVPSETMSVSEFLIAVRRLVVEFVVGRVLSAAGSLPVGGDVAAASLDDVTTYYLLHRHDFGMNDAPAGACILYALSCNLSESELADRYDLLLRTGGVESDDDTEREDDADAEGDEPEGSGSTFKLRPWKQRRRPTLGIDPIAEQARQRHNDFRASGEPLFEDLGVVPPGASGRPRVIPLIDSIHRLMHFWAGGDVVKVNEYLDERGLRRSETFRQVLQALIELAGEGTEERAVLESLSNHVRALGERADSLLDKVRG